MGERKPITSRADILEAISKEGLVIIPFKEWFSIFDGRQLDPAEMEFKKALFSVSGQAFIKKGSSQHDQVLSFCSENNLNLRMLKKNYLLWKTRIDLESFINSDL